MKQRNKHYIFLDETQDRQEVLQDHKLEVEHAVAAGTQKCTWLSVCRLQHGEMLF